MGIIAGATYREGVAYSPDGAMYVTPTGTSSITGGTITGVSGVPYTLFRNTVPVFIACTGTMANNGAITLGTALNTTYAAAYVHLPAGAIAAGVPASADTYYVVMSSSTVGQVFNNLLSANLDANGLPTIPASPTAFATTGPGAFTGVTGSVTLITAAVPASTISTTGSLDFDGQFAFNTSAVNKLVTLAFGGTTFFNANLASTAGERVMARITNRNSAAIQTIFAYAVNSGSTVTGGATTYGAVNTATSLNFTIAMTHSTATDNAVIENVEWRVTK